MNQDSTKQLLPRGRTLGARPVLCGLAALAALAIAVGAPLGASTFLHTPLRELVRDADAIVSGTVFAVDSFWDERGQVIVSEASIFVDDAIAGNGPTVEKVRTFGGTVNGYTVDAHGFPKFAAGDRVLVFLGRQSDGSTRVLGYQEGHYRLAFDASGVERAYPTLDQGARFLLRGAAAEPSERATPAPEAFTEFRDRLRAIADDLRATRNR